MLLALHVFVTFNSVFLSVLFGYYCFSYFDFKSLFLLVLADKGFLIQDLVADGVSVNISPFLNNGHSLKVKQGQQRP